MTATRHPTPLDTEAVADRLGVKVGTVWKWRSRGVMPPEDGTVSGAPWWWLETIDPWAAETGRAKATRLGEGEE